MMLRRGLFMAKSMEKQAERLLVSRHLELSSRHLAKARGDASSKIRSLSTFHRYRQALILAGKWARLHHGIRRLDHLTPAMAEAYLDHRRTSGISQKQLDNDRAAMQFVTGKLASVKSLVTPSKESRVYSRDEVERIATRQSEKNGLATRIAYDAGLRAHELLTLRLRDEDEPSSSDKWRSDRFLGRTGVSYLVKGKGGLVREVLLSQGLSLALEAHRLDEPRVLMDRHIPYVSYYEIGGGMAWSKSFTKCSQRELGFSRGGHGLRHSYVQTRYDWFRARGYSVAQAKLIVSQEMGHFRPSVVENYLR